jgi:hypothetical protein
LRHQRDWLFRTNRARGPIFADWANAPKHVDEFLLKVIERSYAFLVPRFMSFQEWTVDDPRLKKKPSMRTEVW